MIGELLRSQPIFALGFTGGPQFFANIGRGRARLARGYRFLLRRRASGDRPPRRRLSLESGECIMAKEKGDKKHADMAQAGISALGPFELKDELIKAAGGGAVERPANASMLNAGRGNPNFLAMVRRYGFWQPGLFAMRESERSFAYMPDGVGGFPRREGLEEHFDLFLRENRGVAGIDFLRGAMSYVRDQSGYSAADFLYEMCEGILASNYPVPDRMLKLSKLIVGQDQRRKPSVHRRHRQGTSRADWRI
jgi:hypothetical protein